jgi:hypothetical protein
MLEIIIILCLINGFSAKSMFGKDFHALTQAEMQKLENKYRQTYAKFIKKGQEPPMTIEQYLPIMQKQGKTSLTVGFVLIPVYALLLIVFFSL